MSEYVSGHAAKVMKADGKWRTKLCGPLFICVPSQVPRDVPAMS